MCVCVCACVCVCVLFERDGEGPITSKIYENNVSLLILKVIVS